MVVGRITEVGRSAPRERVGHASADHIEAPPPPLSVLARSQVGQRRWKVDTNARQEAVLLLSSINLPGGVQVGGVPGESARVQLGAGSAHHTRLAVWSGDEQRRKSESDELAMRQFYTEGDLLSVRGAYTRRSVPAARALTPQPLAASAGGPTTAQAKVESFFQDGALSLHTRSMKYGKVRRGHAEAGRQQVPCAGAHRRPTHLADRAGVPQLTNGTFLVVPPALVKRSSSHFVTLPYNVDVILGLNGYLWVSVARGTGAPGAAADRDAGDGDEDDELDLGRDNDAEPQAPFGGADDSEVRGGGGGGGGEGRGDGRRSIHRRSCLMACERARGGIRSRRPRRSARRWRGYATASARWRASSCTSTGRRSWTRTRRPSSTP